MRPMPLYKIKTLNRQGKIQQVIEHYPNPEAMEIAVMDNGLVLVEYEEKKDKWQVLSGLTEFLHGFSGTPKLSAQDIYHIFYETGVMLNAGFPILKAVKMVAEGCKRRPARQFLNKVAQLLKEGRNMSDILGEQNHAYDFKPILPLVQMGEKTGKLGRSFLQIAENHRAWLKIKNEISSALIYPTLLVLMGFIALYVILTYVIPRFQDVIKGYDTTLPLLTTLMFKFSSLLSDQQSLIIGGLIVVLSVLLVLMRVKAFKTGLSELMSKAPVIKGIRFNVETVKFLNSFSSLFSGGVPILSCLQLAIENYSSVEVRTKLGNLVMNVRKGEGLGLCLKRTGLFPEVVGNMIQVGEESGTLDKVLEELSNYMNEKLLLQLKRLLNLLEPLVMLIMALFVGLILLSVIPVLMSLGDLSM